MLVHSRTTIIIEKNYHIDKQELGAVERNELDFLLSAMSSYVRCLQLSDQHDALLQRYRNDLVGLLLRCVVIFVAHIYPPVTRQRRTLNIGRSAHFSLQRLLSAWKNPYLLRSFQLSNVLWNSSLSCPLNLVLVRSHQAEINIVKCLILGRNYVTRMRVESKSCDEDRCKNDAFTHLATLPTNDDETCGSDQPIVQWLTL